MGDGSCRIQDNKFKNSTLEGRGRKHGGVGRKWEEEKRKNINHKEWKKNYFRNKIIMNKHC